MAMKNAAIKIDASEFAGRPSLNHDALLKLLNFLESNSYRFITVTPLTHARINTRANTRAATPIDMRAIFGWNRSFTEADAGRELFELMRAADILEPGGSGWRSRIRISSLDSVLFVHSAFPTTQADAIFFGPDTYRFIAALKYHLSRRSQSIKRILDIGCGAGPGAIIAARLFPDAEVIGADINEAALDTARFNAVAAQTSNVSFVQSNLFDNLSGDFDLIIANPPYLVDASQRAYRHGGGALGAGLSEAIVQGSIQRLSANGSLMLYTGVAICNGIDPFRQSAGAIIGNDFKWIYEEIDPDIFSEELLQQSYVDCDRIAAVRLEIFPRNHFLETYGLSRI